MKRISDGLFSAPCPFHAEKSPSFNIGGRKGFEQRFHCFGCGWDGDVFAFWQELKGCDFKQALTDLAQLCGVSMGADVRWTRPEVPVARQPEKRLDDEQMPPRLPPLRHLREAECAEIAVKRGLDAEAVWTCAREYGRMAFSRWPLYERTDGSWQARCETHGQNGCLLERNNCVAAPTWPSWCAIDRTRFVAEFRRLDNERYPLREGSGIKSWSTRGKNWPLGASMINDRPAVMLVEGGPDMIAAYHFLRRHRTLDRVAVVCMLGAGNRMREESLPYFAGKRVRIMVDADELKDGVREDGAKAKKRSVPGMEAAARWSAQLTTAGAAVETFCVGPVYEPEDLQRWAAGEMAGAAVRIVTPGLHLADGTPVKDLNDLAKCGDDVLGSDDVRQAFRAWDF